MADPTPGRMDIAEHERTFSAFIRFTVRAVIVILALLILLALVNG